MKKAAIVDADGFVTAVFVVRSVDEFTGAVECPEHIGIGMSIGSEAPNETVEQTIARYEMMLDDHMDSVALAHRWQSRVTFALRAGYPNEWREQGTAFGIWMDTCNSQALALLNDVSAGLAEMPTPEAFISALPVFELPE